MPIHLDGKYQEFNLGIPKMKIGNFISSNDMSKYGKYFGSYDWVKGSQEDA